MSVKEIIKKRVSQSNFSNRKIDVELLVNLLEDAVYAPNHKMRQPWRFIILEGIGKENFKKKYLGELKEEARNQFEIKFNKVFSAPSVVAFLMTKNDNIHDDLEDMQAVAALIQNFLLLLTELNIGSHWKTPPYIETDIFKDVLGVKTNEIVLGLVMVGYPEISVPSKPRKTAQSLTTIYR
ncbi:MAG: nitroreductase [Tenericutes bacterium]|nr:nitroreductase [Mycoplasmatota bacterium]